MTEDKPETRTEETPSSEELTEIPYDEKWLVCINVSDERLDLLGLY